MKTSNKKMTKKEINSIKVWSEINSSLVEQFGPKQPVEEVSEVVVEQTRLSGQDQIIQVLQQATAQLKTNDTIKTETAHALTKADIGRTIFEQELPNGLVRKDVIARLINEAGLTKNGAATYFQNMKKKAGLVHAKA